MLEKANMEKTSISYSHPFYMTEATSCFGCAREVERKYQALRLTFSTCEHHHRHRSTDFEITGIITPSDHRIQRCVGTERMSCIRARRSVDPFHFDFTLTTQIPDCIAHKLHTHTRLSSRTGCIEDRGTTWQHTTRTHTYCSEHMNHSCVASRSTKGTRPHASTDPAYPCHPNIGRLTPQMQPLPSHGPSRPVKPCQHPPSLRNHIIFQEPPELHRDKYCV